MSAGTTLNDQYNACLVRWGHEGHYSAPECEECECNITGQHVFATPLGWYCEGCYERYLSDDAYNTDDRATERKALGLSAQ